MLVQESMSIVYARGRRHNLALLPSLLNQPDSVSLKHCHVLPCLGSVAMEMMVLHIATGKIAPGLVNECRTPFMTFRYQCCYEL